MRRSIKIHFTTILALLGSGCPDASPPGLSEDTGESEGTTSGSVTTRTDATADTSTTTTSTQPPPTGDKFVGNITTSGQVRPDFIQYWNQITPENEGKWGHVEPTRDFMNWGPLDAVYQYSRDQGIPFKGHTLVWGSQQPSWIGGLSQTEQREEVEEWIRLFCERYPEVEMIDVVNEPPPHTTPPYMQAIGGAGASGYDWIIWSFETTRRYCPNAILILNDYNVLVNETQRFVGIVNAVKGSGVIDAIGAQAHGLEYISQPQLQANLELVLSTGLPLYVSEYDLDIGDDNQQRNVMSQQFPLFWNDDRVVGITLWGYIYGSTWRQNTGLIRNGQPRPAMTWLMEFLGR